MALPVAGPVAGGRDRLVRRSASSASMRSPHAPLVLSFLSARRRSEHHVRDRLGRGPPRRGGPRQRGRCARPPPHRHQGDGFTELMALLAEHTEDPTGVPVAIETDKNPDRGGVAGRGAHGARDQPAGGGPLPGTPTASPGRNPTRGCALLADVLRTDRHQHRVGAPVAATRDVFLPLPPALSTPCKAAGRRLAPSGAVPPDARRQQCPLSPTRTSPPPSR